jgi:secondary thiamine-phosphate synthase enzyme
MTHTDEINVVTRGKSTLDITDKIEHAVRRSGCQAGICNVFIHHTSASLILCENADPSVRTDLERWMSRLVKEGDPIYTHIHEGKDDMPGHIRSVLTASSVSIPVRGGQLALGTWQGLYLWEHRDRSHQRTISVTVVS